MRSHWVMGVGVVCAVLIAGTIILGQMNNELNRKAMDLQGQFNQAQQMRGTGQNLVNRIAQAAAKDTALQELLARHHIKVNSEPPAKPAEPAAKPTP